MQRAFPGLDQERAMKTDSRAEYEAYIRFMAPFSKADTLEKLIKESACQAKDLNAAKAFREESREDALKKVLTWRAASPSWPPSSARPKRTD